MSTDEVLKQRLDSFERNQVLINEKLDKMSEAILMLARVEERQVADHQDLIELKKAQNTLFDRLRATEATQAVSVSKMGSGERLFWTLGGAVLTFLSAIAVWKFK